jgi:inner membrane protein
MSPLTHLLASWIVAAKTTDNLRDRRLVSLAGVAPDLDGLGIVLDFAHGANSSGKFYYYPLYHHFLTHGLPAALICSGIMAVLARRHGRVFCLAFLTFHLHLLCDLVGSRGPDKNDIWPILYFAPINSHLVFTMFHTPLLKPFAWLQDWSWSHQWRLDGWQNMVITFALLLWALWIAVKQGDSFVGVINHKWDQVFVGVLRKWYEQLKPKLAAAKQP